MYQYLYIFILFPVPATPASLLLSLFMGEDPDLTDLSVTYFSHCSTRLGWEEKVRHMMNGDMILWKNICTVKGARLGGWVQHSKWSGAQWLLVSFV